MGAFIFPTTNAGGGGGGTGGLTEAEVRLLISNLFKDARFDEASYEMVFTQHDGQVKRVSLSSIKQLLDRKAENLAFSAGEDFLQLLGANSKVLSNIPLMTDQQVQEIKNLFV